MSVLPRRPNILAFVCLVLGERFANTFLSQVFGFILVIGIKTYPGMDLPVYGEADVTNFILTEDLICKL